MLALNALESKVFQAAKDQCEADTGGEFCDCTRIHVQGLTRTELRKCIGKLVAKGYADVDSMGEYQQFIPLVLGV